MLTFKDLEEIRKLVEEIVTEKTKFLPTKDEFFTAMDKLMGEIQTSRDAQIILNGRTSEHTDILEDHEERITKLEHFPHASI